MVVCLVLAVLGQRVLQVVGPTGDKSVLDLLNRTRGFCPQSFRLASATTDETGSAAKLWGAEVFRNVSVAAMSATGARAPAITEEIVQAARYS